MWLIEKLNNGNISYDDARNLAQEMPLFNDKMAVHNLAVLREVNSTIQSIDRQMAISNSIARQSLNIQKEILAVQEEILNVQKQIFTELREIKNIVNTLKIDERNDRRAKLLGATKYMRFNQAITSDFLEALDSLNLQLKHDMFSLGKKVKETRVMENIKNYALLMPLITDIFVAYCGAMSCLEFNSKHMIILIEYALDWQEELKNHPNFEELQNIITGGFLNAKQRNPIICNFIMNADIGFLSTGNNKDTLITRNKPNLNDADNFIKYGVSCIKKDCNNIVATKYGSSKKCLYHIEHKKDVFDKNVRVAKGIIGSILLIIFAIVSFFISLIIAIVSSDDKDKK
ncbi:MAG: hypothetical protein LBH40_05705 [Alphaproteobacteria bacterium]|jgi:hypothetical protein|nr:hypothetical protein [Alphaproteobacteria bacterium]